MAIHLAVTEDRIGLYGLAKSIRASSNFRFEWQFYDYFGPYDETADSIRSALNLIAVTPELHDFLRSSLDEIYPREFTISPLHEHASIVRDEAYFLDSVTCASRDRLGAYSRDLSASTAAERRPVHELFSSIGEYRAYYTRSGSQPGCEICKIHNNDLFTNWHYDVAWDYTFVVTWQEASLLWLGCLTDTD